jgi:hypothetical protein
MDPGDLRFERALPTPEASGLERRYRFRLGGQTVDAVLPDATATVWRQAHPDAGEGELDSWAISEGERALRAPGGVDAGPDRRRPRACDPRGRAARAGAALRRGRHAASLTATEEAG